MEIAIIAGEVSGDIQAGRLVREIKNISPDARIWGICGPNMRDAGALAVSDITELAVVGFYEVIKNYARIRKVFYKILNEIKIKRPDMVILVDYPGFNLRLAKEVKQLGIPIIYYISPQVWAWGRGRIKQIRELVTKMIVIFPFEKELYEKEGVPVEFVGHPILNIIEGRKFDKNRFISQIGLLPNEKLVGVLPGSRVQEVKRHLPVFIESAKKIKGARFVIGAASESIYKLICDIVKKKGADIQVFLGQTYDIMDASDLILTSSGTATLETACFGTPMVVIYKLNWLTYFFISRMAHVPYIAMANLIAGKKVVPELVQHEANMENIAREALQILESPEKIRRELVDVKQKLGEIDAARKAAKIICKVITG